MAEKRMFTQKIIDSDPFLDMPLSTQALYFHLNMRADDDGFINNPKRIQRTIGASEDDLKLLIAKRFLICFESGVIVIKHWRMHNTLRKDRYNPTQYQEEMALLDVKDNNSYTEKHPDNLLATTCQPNGNQLEPQYSIDKYSKEKVSLVEESTDSFADAKEGGQAHKKEKRFIPPTVEEVREYCESRNNGIDAEMFVSFYESKGWMIGKNKMKSWKSAVVTWEQKRKNESVSVQPFRKQTKADELNDFYKMAADWGNQ